MKNLIVILHFLSKFKNLHSLKFNKFLDIN